MNARWKWVFGSGRGAEHRVGYHKLVPDKREWNSCFIKYQTFDFVYMLRSIRVNIATVYYLDSFKSLCFAVGFHIILVKLQVIRF